MAAIYCRLSRDDGGDAESNSIGNQREQLQRYANEHGFIIFDEYIDDGISGTTFERDSFKRLIADIEGGQIGIILCKDLSRLGRNNAMVAFYTEIFLPDHDVRLICVNDSIDTGVGENEIMAFKSVINEYYARDISKKIRSSRRVQAQKGEFYGSHTPYGYIRCPEDHHKLIIDEDAASVVRQIFQMKADGLGNFQITKALNRQNILVPSAYKLSKYGVKSVKFDKEYPHDWRSTSVMHILENQVYVGNMVGHKSMSKSFKSSKNVEVPESEWIIVEGTHEAIIDKDLFDRVQRMRKVKKRENKTHGENIFAGLIYCSDCGYRLNYHSNGRTQERAGRFICGKYAHSAKFSRDHAKCTMHNIAYKTLYKLTLAHVRELIASNLTVDDILKKLREHNNFDHTSQKRLDKLKKRSRELNLIIQKIVEQNALGEITKTTFTGLYGKFNEELESVTAEINRIEENLSVEERNKENAERFLEKLRKYSDCQELTHEILLDLIDRIVVHEATGDKKSGTHEQVIEYHWQFIGQI